MYLLVAMTGAGAGNTTAGLCYSLYLSRKPSAFAILSLIFLCLVPISLSCFFCFFLNVCNKLLNISCIANLRQSGSVIRNCILEFHASLEILLVTGFVEHKKSFNSWGQWKRNNRLSSVMPLNYI